MINITVNVDAAELEDYVLTFVREECIKQIKQSAAAQIQHAVFKYIDSEITRVMEGDTIRNEIHALAGAQFVKSAQSQLDKAHRRLDKGLPE